LKEEKLNNYIDFITDLVNNDYHGEVITSFNRGNITISRKNDNIKFDNKNYGDYKNRIDNK
jgi:hypothetical protein